MEGGILPNHEKVAIIDFVGWGYDILSQVFIIVWSLGSIHLHIL